MIENGDNRNEISQSVIEDYLNKFINKEVFLKEFFFSSLLEKPIIKEYRFNLKKAVYGKLTYNKRIYQLMIASSTNEIQVISGIEKVFIDNENLVFTIVDNENLKNTFEFGLIK